MHISYSLVLDYQMTAPPTEGIFRELIQEYRRHWLLFLYLAPNGDPWGQWYLLRKTPYLTKADELSPAPPAAEYAAWLAEYQAVKQMRSTANYGVLPGAAPMPQRPGSPPVPPILVQEVLRQCRAAWPSTDEAMASRIVMAATAVFPGWTVTQVGPSMKEAWRRNQTSPALFLTTLPTVLRTWRERIVAEYPLLSGLHEPEPDFGVDQATIDALDQERKRRAVRP